MTMPDSVRLAARLTAEVRPALGEAGCLLPVWNDVEAVRLLELLGLAPPFEWLRDARHPGSLRLKQPVLGIVVLAGTPEGLADGIEHIGRTVDAILTHGRPGPDAAPRMVVAALRAHFATRPPSAPMHVAFEVADTEPAGTAAWDVDGWREQAHAPEVEDHRPFGSALSRRESAHPRRGGGRREP